MEEVLIVSKTHMKDDSCVGGLVLSNNKCVRLLNKGNHNQPADTDFQIGQIWNLRFFSRNSLISPHNEDVIVIEKKFSRMQLNLSAFLSQRNIIDWSGNIENLYDGLLSWRPNGSGYINAEESQPQKSVGFWKSDEDLRFYTDSYKNKRYRYSDNRNLKFVGFQNIIHIIPAGTIIRVSLTRSFPTGGVEGCWLQLSGWYID